MTIITFILLILKSVFRVLLFPFAFLGGLLFKLATLILKSAPKKVNRPHHLTLRLHHKKRGRPRKLPLHIYLQRKLKKFFRKFFPSPLRVGIALGVLLVGLFVYSLFLIVIARDLPSPTALTNDNNPLSTEIYDRNGQLLYRIYEGRNRTLVNLSDVPENMINATIAIEDKNFWDHPGIDLVGISRAVLNDVQGKSDLQGASTITQQLIKNTLLTNDRTWQRKAKEILLSFWTERLFTKQQILQMYFNNIGYGGPAWGVEAAAESYFHKSSKELDLAESAYLAGLPQEPSIYSPFGPHPELGIERQHEVLVRMVAEGYITKDAAQAAEKEHLDFQQPISNIKAPHFVMYVRSLLAQKYGERAVSEGGLRVTTSLDLGIQTMAEQVVADEVNNLSDLNVSNGAAMVEDPKTGQILAMVGSKNYYDPNGGNFNVALALRQPGSSIKPITYATGFKQGYSPGNILLDNPTVFNNPWGQSYAPVNYDGKFHGAVTIRTALGSSFNIPAVKMLSMVGIPAMLQTAHDMGITSLNDTSEYGLSLTLGAGEVKLIDMMTVYSTFSQLGVRHDPNPILKVTDSTGEVLEDNTNTPAIQAIPSGVAYMIANILSDNNARAPEFGTNSLLYIPGHTVAAKTGTTDSKRDNWTFGFTPNYVVGAWVGNNDNEPMNQALASGITGAAPIWNRIMTNLISGSDDIAFAKPDSVTVGTVDGHQDLVLTNRAAKSVAKVSTPDKNNIITYTDPFNTLQSDSSGQIVPNP